MKGNNERVNVNNVDELVKGFCEQADVVKNHLNEALSKIERGIAPSNEEVLVYTEGLNVLTKKYDNVVSAAKDFLSKDELPEDNSPVDDYLEAVKNSKLNSAFNEMQDIVVLLEKFVNVHSDLDSYMKAFIPFRDEIIPILAELKEALNNKDSSIAIPDINAQRLFVKVVETENLDNDEGLELLEQVSELYPVRIQTGLSRKQYYIREINEEFGSEAGQELEKDKNEQNPSTEDKREDTILNDEQVNDLESENKSDFIKDLEENNLIQPLDERFGMLSSDKSQSEDKKVTASVFINDIRKGNPKATGDIIHELLLSNVITEKLILLRFPTMPYNVVSLTLGQLQKNGYIRKYNLVSRGEFYVITRRLEKALSFSDASKFVGQRQYKRSEGWEEIEDRSSSAAARIAMSDLYADCVTAYIKKDIKRHSYDCQTFSEAVILKVGPSDKQEDSDLIVISFWTEDIECDAFLEKLKEKCDSEIKRVIIVALNKQNAFDFANILRKSIEFGESVIYLYSFEDGHYYTYEKIEKIEKEKIWDISNDELNEDEDSEDIVEEKKLEEKERSEDVAFVSENQNNPENDLNQDKIKDEVHKKEKIKEEKDTTDSSQLTNNTRNEPTFDMDSFYNNIFNFCSGKKYYCATAYAKAISNKKDELLNDYERIAYALNDPMRHCSYASDNVFNIIPDERNSFSDAMVIAIGLRTFFSDQVRYDYNIAPFYTSIKEYPIVNDYPSLGKVLYTLLEFKESCKKGMDFYADYRAKSHSELENEIRQIEREAKLFYESTIAGKKSERANQRRFLETKKMLFDIKGDIGIYIKAVAEGDKDIQPLVTDFLRENFIKEGNTIAEDTIDSDLLWQYINIFWDKAGEKMMMKLRADLMSHLRSNIVKTTTKAVQILAKWSSLVDVLNNQTEDEGTVKYKKVKKGLLENINQSITEMDEDINNPKSSIENTAGLSVIINALSEIKSCIEGSFDEKERQFFYVPFLSTDDVLLDDSYLPDLDPRSAEIDSLQPEYRILEHSRKEQEDLKTRLKDIVEEKGDDYGEARLICDYLLSKEDSEEIKKVLSDVNAGEEYAKETADLRKEDFIGELELAQSFGQIDNSSSLEDKKDKILQIVDLWYEWAIDSSNYGFFKKVMDCYLIEIRNEAKAREKDLLEQLESFKNTSIKGLSTESKEKRVQKIKKTIDQQNYTVAEDLLARADQMEEELDSLIDEDFLRDFIENYDDYYKPVATHRANFSSLVSSKTRNKEERGAKRLSENWLTGGGYFGKERLAVLLSSFGFKLESGSIKNQTAIGKFENFFVKTMSEKCGKRANYTHPIAAFGSGASQEGFRVVVVNGGYDADGLIDVMKQIGNAKHTLILFDYAMPLSERRRLARKSKEALGDKLFAVVDRAVMMYMIKNYDETKANRMLLSLVVPFGYYQPYVWESSNVMPPEIFMGRKIELEKIESPTGVNIVYGGRQLGKSALLRKAKADIDWDENGDRAILIEIKGLNYEEAAKKVGHALYDEQIISTDISTTDWAEIARVLKKRLQSGSPEIPYLLLLMDEADAFIESCEEVNYKPLDALKDIQSIGAGRFKFVIAGLRNIVRFKREAALGNNSVLTHLESMTVKPFKAREARELMEIPLHYLGLKFPKEKESLVTLILATTNYFPGLIQLYCAKLLEAMRNKDYAGYDEVDTPIYEVSEDHIKKVLADPEFMQQIREKYIITLKLDEDNYYYLIALIMAYLYHNNGYNEGYSADEIRTAGKELGIEKISSLSVEKLTAFMEELDELNVLRNTDDTHYLFTRFTFFQMMGTLVEVENKLVEYMED